MAAAAITGGISQGHARRSTGIIGRQFKTLDVHAKMSGFPDLFTYVLHPLAPQLAGPFALADKMDGLNDGFIVAEVHGKTDVGLA